MVNPFLWMMGNYSGSVAAPHFTQVVFHAFHSRAGWQDRHQRPFRTAPVPNSRNPAVTSPAVPLPGIRSIAAACESETVTLPPVRLATYLRPSSIWRDRQPGGSWTLGMSGLLQPDEDQRVPAGFRLQPGQPVTEHLVAEDQDLAGLQHSPEHVGPVAGQEALA